MQQIGTANITNSLHPNIATPHSIYNVNGQTIAIDNTNSKLSQNADGNYTLIQNLSPEQLAAMYKCQPNQIGSFQAIG